MTSNLRRFRGTLPTLGAGVYIADTAVVIGDVELGDEVSIWFGAVLRGDVGSIRIGARSNIQDASVLHMSRAISNTEIGEEVTVGHGVIIHGAKVGNAALIGMGAILLDNAVIGDEALVAAGSLVPSGFVVPPRHLAMGRPAKISRQLTPEEWSEGRRLALRYVELAREY